MSDANADIENNSKRIKDLEKKANRLTLISSILGALCLLMGTIATGYFDFVGKKGGHDVDLTRIALAILAGDNPETSRPARRFAVDLLAHSTGVEISREVKTVWVEEGTLPETFKNVSDTGSGLRIDYSAPGCDVGFSDPDLIPDHCLVGR